MKKIIFAFLLILCLFLSIGCTSSTVKKGYKKILEELESLGVTDDDVTSCDWINLDYYPEKYLYKVVYNIDSIETTVYFIYDSKEKCIVKNGVPELAYNEAFNMYNQGAKGKTDNIK